MHSENYRRNNLQIILESIGFKLDGTRKISFPLTKEVRNKLGISATRFRQLISNDQDSPSITYPEISVLANHFGCDPELLTQELPVNAKLELQLTLNESFSESFA
uniref:hypothetical protein n=1 Tax=Roseivirga sp. TaxID=1964215 RepID=UPI0040470663